ncbi:hypothetical protein HNW13_017870 [Shewanella sp. BF02_Schw]|uniref:hypothetical protein n=1 Tax=Shewanella sp. BF02_Schw TaxID=394908 RepID=UPI001784F5FB|nr:hypothetical protein [Shewanella sp. BF02_Schw]MBO1897607.1 hypothetical protein [Shewanella sp. BF02_Schw]
MYKYKYDKAFDGQIICEVIYIDTTDRGWKGYREFAVKKMAKELSGTKVEGENPSVFQWVLGSEDPSGASCGQLIFYGNLVVYLAFVPKSFNVKNYVNLFDIAQTVSKTVYIKKDGQQYRIN